MWWKLQVAQDDALRQVLEGTDKYAYVFTRCSKEILHGITIKIRTVLMIDE